MMERKLPELDQERVNERVEYLCECLWEELYEGMDDQLDDLRHLEPDELAADIIASFKEFFEGKRDDLEYELDMCGFGQEDWDDG